MSSAPTVPYGPTAPAVPSSPSVAPPQGSFTQGDQATTPQQPDQVAKILQTILAQQQKPQLQAPVPAPIPEPQQRKDSGSNLGNFANHFSSQIQTAIANKKKADLSKAESDWNQFNAALQQGPEKAQLWLAQNEKAAKNMAKSFNQDWLNPEKTNLYGQARDNFIKQQKAKGQAATGLKAMMQKLIGKAQNPQLTDSQKTAIAQEQMSKAPLVTPQPDMKELMPLITEQMRAENASTEQAAKDAAADKRQEEKEEFDSYQTEQKQKFEKWSTEQKDTTQEHLTDLREKAADIRASAHDMTMLKAAGMKIDQSQMVKPSEINSSLNSTVRDLSSQASRATQQLKTLQTQAQSSKKWFNVWQGSVGSDQIQQAQAQIDGINAAIKFIDSQKGSIVKMAAKDPAGAADLMDEVSRKANDMANGVDADPTAPAVSGGGSAPIVVSPQDMK